MSAKSLGPIKWNVKQSADGYRDYSLVSLVQTDSDDSGPSVVLACPDLPAVGSSWSWSSDENDIYVYCTGEMSASQRIESGERTNYWEVTQAYSNRPQDQQQAFDNPLDVPAKISGSFAKITKPTSIDKDGALVKNSSYQLYPVHRDFSLPTVSIEMNMASLPLVAFCSSSDYVNGAVLWGLPARTVKLSSVSWERVWHQASSGFYFVVKYQFEICYDTWDFKEPDYGTKILKPGGTATNPNHYIAYRTAEGDAEAVLLNGSGAPLTAGGSPVINTYKIYPEADFPTLLGIPSVL